MSLRPCILARHGLRRRRAAAHAQHKLMRGGHVAHQVPVRPRKGT